MDALSFAVSPQVAECEQLGNHVYHYDAEDKVFEKASAYEARQAEKSKGRDTAKDKASIMKKLDDRKKGRIKKFPPAFSATWSRTSG